MKEDDFDQSDHSTNDYAQDVVDKLREENSQLQSSVKFYRWLGHINFWTGFIAGTALGIAALIIFDTLP